MTSVENAEWREGPASALEIGPGKSVYLYVRLRPIGLVVEPPDPRVLLST